MDEREFLLSEAYRQYLERVVRTVSGMYDLQVVFSEHIQTDGRVIHINPLSPLLSPLPTLEQKTLAILGQLAHEYFHVAYTDFRAFRLLPAKMRQETPFRREMAYRLLNIVEDAAVERLGCAAYRGLFRRALAFSNHVAFSQMPAIDRLQRQGAPAFEVLSQATLMQAVLGRVKGDWLDASLAAVFGQALPILEKGKHAPDSMARLRQAEALYRLYLPWIEEMERSGAWPDASFQYVKPIWRLSTNKGAAPFPLGTSADSFSSGETADPFSFGVSADLFPSGDAAGKTLAADASGVFRQGADGGEPVHGGVEAGGNDADRRGMNGGRSERRHEDADGWRWDEEAGHRVAGRRKENAGGRMPAEQGLSGQEPVSVDGRGRLAVERTGEERDAEPPGAEPDAAAGGGAAEHARFYFRWKWFRFGKRKRPGGKESRQMADTDVARRARRGEAAERVSASAPAGSGRGPASRGGPSDAVGPGGTPSSAASEGVPPGATQAGEASGAGPAGAAPSGETPPGAAPTKKPLPVPAASGELSVKGAGVPAEASGSGGAPSGAEDVRTGSGIAWDPDLRQVAEALVSVRAAAVREAKEKEKAGAVARAMRRRGERLATGLHQGIRVFANREFSLTQEDREKYRRLEAETHWLVQSMIRQWQQWVMGEQPLRETGLYSGKLDGRRLWRHDTRLFYRRNGPAGGGDLAILLLVDESGSMKESARWHHAQRACLVLEAVCRACRLPFAVLGHLAVYGQPHVVHHHYLDFGPRPADHRERLVMLGPKENTREGLSLRYAAEYIREAERAGMLGVVGQVRPLILSISDGRPVHDAERWTLKGAAAQADARAAVRELARDGIHVIGVAIGDEPSAIGEVYPHALEVRRVEDLPQRLLRTLRQWAEAGLNQGSL